LNNYDSTKIRSLALVGHAGCGKTSIADAMAVSMGCATRLGRVDDRTSLFDFEPEEHKRGGSTSASFLTGEYDGFKIHVVDTPGEGNFLHEARGALQGVNAAVIVISAVDGIEVSTEHVSGYATNQGLPRAIFINKMDREHADYEQVVSDLTSILGVQPVLMQLPIGTENDFKGVVDLINRRALVYDASGQPVDSDIPADMVDEVEAAIEEMMEAVAMADDALVEKYLDAGELTQDEIREGLNKGILAGTVCPVFMGSAAKNIGVDRILWAARALPNAEQRTPVVGHKSGDPDALVEIAGDSNAGFAALCIKTIIDPYAGQLSVFRVFSGTMSGSVSVCNAATGKNERAGSIFHLIGKEHITVDEVKAGDIFALAKLKHVVTGDTLCDDKKKIVLPYIPPPPGMISYTIKPKTRGDVDKLKGGLARLLSEDPALRQSFDDVTKELVLSGMGASHVQISIDKLQRKFSVGVNLGTPAIPYRETIQGNADVRYRHKKQTGGAGQFGEVSIRVMPAERGSGYVFVDKIKGGVIPNALIPSVEKGVGDQLKKGVLAGFPCVDVKVELYDGKYHPVDSKDIAFQIAGRQAIKDAIMKCRPSLLEPIYKVDVVVPSEMVGDVMGDMNSRRGRVLNMDSRGRNSVVRALVPLAEMLNYAPDLRSMSGGKGSYSMEFEVYEPVPAHLQDKVVQEVSRNREEAD